jgi:hypothetical protein
MHTARDILFEETVTMNICVYRIEELPQHEWLSQRIHCTDEEGTHLKLTIFNDDSLADYEFTEDQWYQIGPCPTDVYGGSIGIKVRRGTEVAEIDDIELTEHPGFGTKDPSLVQLGSSAGRAGIDIETVATVPEHEIEAYKDANSGDVNPEHYELVAVGVGYQSQEDEPTDTEVILREGPETNDEFRVIEDVVDYVRRTDATTLLTFGGTWFDVPVLRGRAEITAETADIGQERLERVHRALDSLFHADLKQGVYRVFDGGSLEETAEKVGDKPPETFWDVYCHDLDPAEARRTFDDGPWDNPNDSEFYNKDMLFFGDQFLKTREEPPESVPKRALYKMIHEYTRTDIAPMFDIADDERFDGLATWQLSMDI